MSRTKNEMMSGFTVFAEDDSLLMGHDVASDGWDGIQTVETMEAPRPRLPGSDAPADWEKDQVDEVRTPKPKKETTWDEHRDVEKFTDYLRDSYPHKIPKHDGKTLVGAQRAVRWLKNISKEISEAVIKDERGILDDAEMEKIRVSIMKDILVLSEHIKKLDKSFKGKLKKKAGLDDGFMKFAEEIEFAYNHDEAELRKTAMIPRIQLVVQPFERAIAGIIVNSVVSGGKPLEEVYDFLKEKYKLTDREELAVMQVVMDYGYPIFKDRGTIGDKADKDTSNGKKHGIEFIKQYFS